LVGGTASTVTESNPSSHTESSTFVVSRDSIPVEPVEPTESNRPRVCFKVVAVRVSGSGSNEQLGTYAFLDSGSDTTLCLRSFLEELSLESEPTDFTLSMVSYQGKEQGYRTCLDIEALDRQTKFTLD